MRIIISERPEGCGNSTYAYFNALLTSQDRTVIYVTSGISDVQLNQSLTKTAGLNDEHYNRIPKKNLHVLTLDDTATTTEAYNKILDLMERVSRRGAILVFDNLPNSKDLVSTLFEDINESCTSLELVTRLRGVTSEYDQLTTLYRNTLMPREKRTIRAALIAMCRFK